MADTADVKDVAPAYIQQSVGSPLSPEEIGSAQEGKSAPVPKGWRVTGGYRSELEVGFADTRTNPFPPGMILGDSDTPPQPVVATERLPELCLFLERPGERCTLTVVETRTPLATIWSRFTIQGGQLTPTPLGRAGVGGPTAVVDSGDRLIRATVDRERHGEPPTALGDRAHFEDVSRAAEQFLDDMIG